MPEQDFMSFQMKASPDSLELLVYDSIGKNQEGTGITAQAVAELLSQSADAKSIDIRILSSGGSVFQAMGIYSALSRHKARKVAHVDLALSAASFVAMAADEIRIAENGMMMIHAARANIFGTAEDMRQMADTTDKVNQTIVDTYAARTGQSKEQVAKWMADETWFDAAEAKAKGFATSITPAKRIAAAVDLSNFSNVPEAARQLVASASVPPSAPPATVNPPINQETKTMAEETKPQPATYAQIVAACKNLDEAKADDALFITSQLKAGATEAAARDAWMDTQTARIEARDAEIEKAKAPKAPGNKAVGEKSTASTVSGDPVAEWNDKIEAKVKSGLPRDRAVSFVNKENPGLRDAFVQAVNANRKAS